MGEKWSLGATKLVVVRKGYLVGCITRKWPHVKPSFPLSGLQIPFRLSKRKNFSAQRLAPSQIAASMKFRTEISDLDDGCLGNIFALLEPIHR